MIGSNRSSSRSAPTSGVAAGGVYHYKDGRTAPLLSHPHGLFGSVAEICDTIVARREQLGISYVTIAQRNMDEFAPVVAALAGT